MAAQAQLDGFCGGQTSRNKVNPRPIEETVFDNLRANFNISDYASHFFKISSSEHCCGFSLRVDSLSAYCHLIDNNANLLSDITRHVSKLINKPVYILLESNFNDFQTIAGCGIKSDCWTKLHLQIINQSGKTFRNSGGRPVVEIATSGNDTCQEAGEMDRITPGIRAAIGYAAASVLLLLVSIVIGWSLYFFVPGAVLLTMIPPLLITASSLFMLIATGIYDKEVKT
jgi:hypothetical protein